ncbi:unnamed protein product [Durusdinium trenchii]|uniref:EF-hand domain-containing protein n=1 Tax=Durusdinium trenchii TaxID=1381693 RepID=A0ABP0QVW0_9DINO
MRQEKGCKKNSCRRHRAICESAESAVLPEDWEKRLQYLLKANNELLIEKLQNLTRVSVVDRLSKVTTESETSAYVHLRTTTGTRPSFSPNLPEELLEEAEDGEEEEPEVNLSRRASDKKRVSMTSLGSEEERAHMEKLKKSQKQRQSRELRYNRSSSTLASAQITVAIKSIVSSWTFEALFAFAILSNSIFIGVEVHFAAHNREGLPPAFFYIDQTYAALFLIELVLRILAERLPFFWSSPNVMWNYLDILINITSVLNLVSFIASTGQDADSFKASGNVRIIRILRLTRVIRVVRIVKIVRFIRALRSLVHSIFGTLKVLLWSVLLLVMIMYVFAIVFCDVSNEYLGGFEDVSDTGKTFLERYFVDLERSIMTLFQSIVNGLNWGDVADELNKLSRIWGYLYVVYIAFCMFAVLNVMTGMFCQSAIESAERDQELHVQAVLNTKQQQVEMFMSIFHMLQKDRGRRASHNQNLTFTEFEHLFDQPHIRSFFQALDVETKDAWTLFKLMDVSGHGDIDASEFVEGCMRLKGPARAIDMSILMQEQRRMRKKLVSMEQVLLDSLGRPRTRTHSSATMTAASLPSQVIPFEEVVSM